MVISVERNAARWRDRNYHYSRLLAAWIPDISRLSGDEVDHLQFALRPKALPRLPEPRLPLWSKATFERSPRRTGGMSLTRIGCSRHVRLDRCKVTRALNLTNFGKRNNSPRRSGQRLLERRWIDVLILPFEVSAGESRHRDGRPLQSLRPLALGGNDVSSVVPAWIPLQRPPRLARYPGPTCGRGKERGRKNGPFCTGRR